MSDATHYQENLAGNKVAIHDGHPKTGYYKLRRGKGQPWLPVAIWSAENGDLVARVAGDMADPHAIWTHCAGNPVSKADAKHAFAHGTWPGDAPAPIGDNLPPSDDPLEAIARELEAERARVEAWIAEPHEGKTAADMAANWLVELRKLEKKTEAAFDAEKAPALAESNRIDTKWRGVKALAEKIKRAMSDRYDAIARKEKKRLQDIADAKARAEAEARQKEWEADQAKKAALAAEHNIHLAPEEPPLFQSVIQADPVKVAFGGAQGAKIAPKKVPAVGLVEDWAKAAAHYSAAPKLRELIQKLVNADSKNGVIVPGVKIIPGE